VKRALDEAKELLPISRQQKLYRKVNIALNRYPKMLRYGSGG
jgi:hypothetical protein